MAYGQPTKPKQTETASGVNVTTIDIKGKQYVPVSARIAEVNISKMTPRWSMISRPQFYEVGGKWHVDVEIEIYGEDDKGNPVTRKQVGTATVGFGCTNPKAIDYTSPAENGITSAIGRALGQAGYGSLESVASADEVVNAINRGADANQGNYKPAGNAAGNGNASGQGFKPTQQTTQPKDDLAALRKRFTELKEKLIAFKEDEDNIDAVVAAHKADPAKMVEMLEKAYLVRCINDAYMEDFPKDNPELIEKAMDKFKNILGSDLYSLKLEASNPALKPSVETLKKLLADIQQMSA